MSKEAMKLALDFAIMDIHDAGYTEVRYAVQYALREALAEQPAPVQQEPVSFLAKGTRFKMSFFDCAAPEGDDHGESDAGTYVTCFESFAKELDGRWVALVAAEDDCHLKLTSPPAQQEPDAIVTSLTAGPDGVARSGLDRELPLMASVYLAPQPAHRKPLTPEKVVKLKDAFYAGFESYVTPAAPCSDVDEEWAKYKSAHNIKEQP